MWSMLGTRKGFALTLILSLLVLAIDATFYGSQQQPPTIIGVAYVGSFILVLLSSVARCHTLNWSGWRVLAFFMPIVGLVLVLLLLFMPKSSSDERASGIS